MRSHTLRIGVVRWQPTDDIAQHFSKVASGMGYPVVTFAATDRLPSDLDIVLATGTFRSWVPLTNQMLARSVSQRPMFVLWLWEELPNPSLPEWFLYSAGALRSLAERFAYRRMAQDVPVLDPRWRWLTSKAHRFRYYGDLHYLRRAGALSLLAISSPWTADYLRLRGFDPLVTYLGAAADWGADLGLVRDIPVLWLGKIGTRRRGRLLQRVRAELKQRGIDILMIDGVEHPYVFGQERTRLLNRTKVVLNLLRAPWEDNSPRFYLAALNRALIVSEPMLPHTPFVPGRHLVESPHAQIADTISYYLAHDEQRQRIVAQAHELVTTDWTLDKVVARIIQRAIAVAESR